MSLDIEKTYRAIVEAARQKRFIAYGELASANQAAWGEVRHQIYQQLSQLIAIAHARGWPLISAMVVNKENVQSGRLDDVSLNGFIKDVRKLGVIVEDPSAFLDQEQKKVFAWAPGAPDVLGANLPNGRSKASPRGPRFVHYFGPVLDGLRALGGEAAPEEVIDWVGRHIDVPADEKSGLNKGGQSKFVNRVAWARFYLTKAGLIDGSRRGVWALTGEGRETELDHAEALEIFREIQRQFRTDEDEDATPPEPHSRGEALFDDPQRQFWFVGALWGQADQFDRFLAEGIWQNGHDNRFGDLVTQMRPGDRIAIKATFVQKNRLPFDNKGNPVSCMRIKATGVITSVGDDGRTVRVEWHKQVPAPVWFFYTYRVTISKANTSDELARRLILFTFAGVKQDHDFWIRLPYFARRYGNIINTQQEDEESDVDIAGDDVASSPPTYDVDSIVADGCFIPISDLELIIERLRTKKNLILQGAPGTGKTWLAKRLAYALIGTNRTQELVQSVQFHPSLSYEDFVRGYRPGGEGGLSLTDGIFLQIVEAARVDNRPHVLIIEEINRGNPAQIFGELLTLLEDSKRDPREGIQLTYPRQGEKPVYIPENLYVIGTMNIADRSLALVDLALRRRFAFVDLKPQMNRTWLEWCVRHFGWTLADVEHIASQMGHLNEAIASDRSLGESYCIGHSYVTPRLGLTIKDPRSWFRAVVDTELVPLLQEYWFDSPNKVREATARLRLAV